MFLRALLVASLLVAGTGPSTAVVPDAFGVQGVLVTPAGQLAPTGQYQLRFGVYPVPIGGGPLYEHTLAVDVAKGLYNVVLPGDGTTPLYDVFSAPPRFLQVEIITAPDPALDGTTQGPRQHLGSIPSAFLASRAEQGTQGAPSLLPTGSIILWDQPDGCTGAMGTCPCGYDEAGEFRGRTVRGADLGGAISDLPDDPGVSLGTPGDPGTFGDQLSDAMLPAHAHGGGTNRGSHDHRFRKMSGFIEGYLVQRNGGSGLHSDNDHRFSSVTNETTATAGAHNHTVNHAGGGGPHYHPLRSVLFCRKR